MNNLLRTLTESQVQATPDLKLLLNTVKDARRQGYDNKMSDPFYESLEGLLHDLRTVTMDNHDAEAFLKPVAKTDVPDYYDVISNPMDLQTMLKKVKAKQYKSKREFKDDLDLIWSNCFTYNATEDHPLRQCALRLGAKADRLLANITDRKDRMDPSIPPDLCSSPPSRPVARPKINGFLSHDRLKSFSASQSQSSSSNGIRSSSSNGIRPTHPTAVKKIRTDVPFGDTPALVRTPEGMATFRSLDSDLEGGQEFVERLRGYVMTPEWESESEDEQGPSGVKLEDAGEKRKLLNGTRHRPRKRMRFTPPDSDDEHGVGESSRNATELWWAATQSDTLLANGLPPLPRYPPSSSSSSGHTPLQMKVESSSPSKPRRRKRLKKVLSPGPPNTLLGIMNSNIKTLKRVRRTHAKFAALNINAEDGTVMGTDEPPEAAEEDPVDEFVDERPWKALVGLKGDELEGGIELGGDRAVHCLRWMNGKVLEHAGFQGASGAALDVLTGVTSEFLLNVGRTLRFLCDKYARTMTPEEIILHTLFESGITKIQDLERYIKDDVIRHGTRLTDLEKKLINAYREATSVDVLDDDALFGVNSEDEESEAPFAMGLGGFSEAFDEDFLGLRELGIAAELGLSSLSVPKRLLKGKRGGASGATKAKPTEPPPPYPPPPPFVPITSKNVEEQIGLLRPYYQERISALATSMPASASMAGGSLIPSASGVPVPGMGPLGIPGPGLVPGLGASPSPSPVPGLGAGAGPAVGPGPQPAVITLPEDVPLPSQAKLGPIGQVMKSGLSTGTVKKKTKAGGTSGTPAPGASGTGSMGMRTMGMGMGMGTGTRLVGAATMGTTGKDAVVPLPQGLLSMKPEGVPMEPLTTFDPGSFGVGVGVTGVAGGGGGGGGGTGGGEGAGGERRTGSGGNGAKKKAVDLPPVIAASA